MDSVMTWNFDYTIPSFVFLLFFLVFYFIKPVIITKSNKYFLSLVIFEIIGFFLAFFSIFLDIHSIKYSQIFLIFIDNFYYGIYIGRYFVVSMYFASLFNVKPKKDVPTIITALLIISFIVLLMFEPVNQLVYTLDSNTNKYGIGPLYILVYVVNIATLLLDIYFVSRYNKKLNKKEKIASLFTIFALFSMCIIDYILTEYLITDTFFLFIILVIYLGFENPDNFIDKKTGLYNATSFISLIQEELSNGNLSHITSFIIKNYSEKKQIYGHKQTDLALGQMGHYFNQLCAHEKCFYLQNGNFIVMSKKSLGDKTKTIQERFTREWKVKNIELHLPLITIDSKVKFRTYEGVMNGYTLAFSEALDRGLDHITLTDEVTNNILRKMQVQKALNKAIVNDSLLVYLQPIVDSKTRKIVAAEALVRMRDEELGIVPPIEFISIAERNGSIEQLGEQVLNKVCLFLNETRLFNYGIKFVNVNLSPIQCQNTNLSYHIDNIVTNNDVDHKYIHLEITEDSMIDSSKLMGQMNSLIEDGYKFSLDDFGSGFSNVIKIRTYPFSNIKLDLSLVWDHFEHPDSMLPSMVSTFKERGLTITAEGVETKEMADGLEKMGVDYLQGFYFSKPIPLDDFVSLVMKQENY